MLSTQQLLELVVANPDRSSCDMRFLLHIWEAFTQWCADKLADRVGVKVLPLGEFGFRRDVIGKMEFFNPMFLMNETFARSHNLHDRRPKTHVPSTEAVDLDLAKIAQITSDLVGEIVTREFVENAIRDIIDRIGMVCADEDLGIIVVDFGFGRLVCENKSIVFDYSGGAKPNEERVEQKYVSLADKAAAMRPATAGPRPVTTASSTRASIVSRASIAASGMSMSGLGTLEELAAKAASLGLSGAEVPGLQRCNLKPKNMLPQRVLPKIERAPLQRPFKCHIKKADQPTVEEILQSHARQIEHKIAAQEESRQAEAASHVDALQRLRSEMVMDFELHEQRRAVQRALAAQHKQQDAEKQEREAETRRVVGVDHWPFRTEEAVREAARKMASRQKEALDQQLAHKTKKEALIAQVSVLCQKQENDVMQRHVVAAQEQATLRAKAMVAKERSLEATMNGAFNRYEEYLDRRKCAVDQSNAFVQEQRNLSDQAELLKQAEQKRRMAEMKRYLDKQVKERKQARNEERETDRLAAFGLPTTLPMHHDPDPAEAVMVAAAMREALDQQKERKETYERNERDSVIRQEKEMNDRIAIELQQTKYYELVAKRDKAEILNLSWLRQQRLRQLEAEIQKSM